MKWQVYYSVDIHELAGYGSGSGSGMEWRRIVSDGVLLIENWLQIVGATVKEVGVLRQLSLGEQESDATAGVAAVLCTLAAIWIAYSFIISCRTSLKLLRLSKTVPCVK